MKAALGGHWMICCQATASRWAVPAQFSNIQREVSEKFQHINLEFISKIFFFEQKKQIDIKEKISSVVWTIWGYRSPEKKKLIGATWRSTARRAMVDQAAASSFWCIYRQDVFVYFMRILYNIYNMSRYLSIYLQ